MHSLQHVAVACCAINTGCPLAVSYTHLVFLYNEPAVDGLRTAGKTLECTAAERERIELTIISQPSVHYMQNFIDSICIDLMEVFNSGGDE